MSDEHSDSNAAKNTTVSSYREVSELCPEMWEVAEKVAARGEVPLKDIAKILLWKKGCTHTETMVHYRENVAAGDFIVWKEICSRCSEIVKSGMGLYKEAPVEGRVTSISPSTNYEDGWYFNFEALKNI